MTLLEIQVFNRLLANQREIMSALLWSGLSQSIRGQLTEAQTRTEEVQTRLRETEQAQKGGKDD